MRVVLDVVRGREAPQALALDAASIADARERAQREGYTVLSTSQRGAPLVGQAWAALLQARSPSRIDATVFVEQLRDLLVAGLSLIEALGTLQQAAPDRERRVIAALIAQLRGGQRLSDSLGAQAGVFSPLLLALVRTSELTSDLPQALTRYLEHERRVADLRHRIASVATYPILLTAVGGGVLLFLLLYVMPRFARVFEGMVHQDLPWSARAMVAWAQGLAGHGQGLLWLLAALAFAALAAATAPAVRARALQAVLQWAPLRARLRTYFLARWYRASGMLATGGIPLPQAVGLANELLPEALKPGGAAVVRALQDGLSPSQAHLGAGMATPVAAQLMRAGERTGGMGEVLSRIAQFHDAEIARTLERRMRALEPVVMVLVGLGVGLVVILMYLPIFELASAIQ
jgi:general secretion pathway protein F